MEWAYMMPVRMEADLCQEMIIFDCYNVFEKRK